MKKRNKIKKNNKNKRNKTPKKKTTMQETLQTIAAFLNFITAMIRLILYLLK